MKTKPKVLARYSIIASITVCVMSSLHRLGVAPSWVYDPNVPETTMGFTMLAVFLLSVYILDDGDQEPGQ